MKRVAILGGKGGVGKSTITLGLATALRDKGHRVGLMDCDFTMPDQLVMLNSTNSKPKLVRGSIIVPPEIEGMKVLSWGSLWREGSAVMIEDRQVDEDNLRMAVNLIKSGKTDAAIKYLERLIESPGGATYYMRQLFEEGLVDWGDCEYLVVDTAPTTGGTIRAVAEVGLDGTIIVTQASKASLADVSRTIDMLRKKQVPIYGVVANMVGRFDLTEGAVVEFCIKQSLPLICSIPFLEADDTRLKTEIIHVADYILNNNPVILKQEEVDESGYKEILKTLDEVGSLFDIFRRR